jgi:GNAT superfamily N-acetyltransferase
MSREQPLGITLRPARPGEAAPLTELCLRSKAHWGYDAAFMAACREELTVSEEVAGSPLVQLATVDGKLAAMAEIVRDENSWHLEKLFVDPPFMRLGLGRRLFGWSVRTAAEHGATSLEIAADPAPLPSTGFAGRSTTAWCLPAPFRGAFCRNSLCICSG